MDSTRKVVTAQWHGQTDPALVVQVSPYHIAYTSSSTSSTKYYNTFVALH